MVESSNGENVTKCEPITVEANIGVLLNLTSLLANPFESASWLSPSLRLSNFLIVVILQVLERPKRLAVTKDEEAEEERDLMEELARDEGFLSRGEVAGDEAFLAQLNCGLSQCTFISCTIGPLAKKQFTLFKVNMTVVNYC